MRQSFQSAATAESRAKEILDKWKGRVIMAHVNRDRFLKGIYWAGPAFVYASLIFFLSSLSRFPDEVPSFLGFDKIVHFIEYFILGVFLYRWFSNMDGCPGRKRALTATIFVGIIYAFTDEWHQSFVPGRDSSLFDVLFDSLGVAAASFFSPFLLQGVKKS